MLGDAAKKIPSSIQNEYPSIPWKKIKGLRDVVVHEYFGTSTKLIWQTIERDLPKLEKALKQMIGNLEDPVHPWKICPPGETYVRQSSVQEHLRDGRTVREHLRRQHCRTTGQTAKSVLTAEEAIDIAEHFFEGPATAVDSDDLGFKARGVKYDRSIQGWTNFWNDVFRPVEPLDPELVKALIASESSFNENSNRRKRAAAKGLMQIMPKTMKYLRGEGGELKNHVFEFTDLEIFEPELNIAAGVRWLFRKRETASVRLKREASWEEAVAEYKDYLHRKLRKPDDDQAGMDVFREFLRRLKANRK